MGLFETPRGERAVTGSVGMRGLKPRYLALKPQTSLPEMPIFQPTLRRFFSADDGNDSGATESSDAAAWQELTDAQKAQMAAAFGLELGGAPS